MEVHTRSEIKIFSVQKKKKKGWRWTAKIVQLTSNLLWRRRDKTHAETKGEKQEQNKDKITVQQKEIQGSCGTFTPKGNWSGGSAKLQRDRKRLKTIGKV